MKKNFFIALILVAMLLINTSLLSFAQAPTGVFLTEVLYDVSGVDDGLEWVELYNTSGAAIDLSGYCLANGGTDYTYSTVQLNGVINPGQVFVVGGPISSALNGNPIFDQSINFTPDFQNGGTFSDGVALFNLPCTSVTALTVPIDAVIYDSPNTNNLLDETGGSGIPDVGDAPSDSSIIRDSRAAGSTWTIGTPDPNVANNPTALVLNSFTGENEAQIQFGVLIGVLALVLVGVLFILRRSKAA